MKKIITTILTSFLLLSVVNGQSVAINNDGSTANASAALDIKSTDKGMLIPRMTTAQREAISSPATGLLVYDITSNSFWFKGGPNWVQLVDTANNRWKENGTSVYMPSPGKVGIGTLNPNHPLDIYTNDVLGGNALRLKNPNSAAGTKTTLLLTSNNTGSNLGASAITSTSSGNGGQHLSFSNVTSSFSPPQERIRIDSAGNVGIGTTNPVEKLEVNGSMRLSGDLRKTGMGSYNFLPFAYGKINANGTIVDGTGNYIIGHTANTGSYQIFFNPTSGLTTSNCLMIITPEFKAGDHAMVSYDQLSVGNIFYAYFTAPWVDNAYCNVSGTGCTTVVNQIYNHIIPKEIGFSFVVYKFHD